MAQEHRNHLGSRLAVTTDSERYTRDQVQQLFLKHSDALRAYVRGLAPPQVDAEEIFQETFITVSEKAEHYDPQTAFLSWAIGIARMKVLGRIRDFQQRGGAMLSGQIIERLAEEPPDEQTLQRNLSALEFCMQRVPPSGYRLLRMFYFEGHSAKVIAERLQVKVQSVYNGLDRVRQRLRACIEQQLGEDPDRGDR